MYKLHHVVVQLLFLTPHPRKDINTVATFLTTIVGDLNEYDCRKIRQILQYVWRTIHVSWIMKSDCLNVIEWWVGTSYAINPDCKSHTRGIILLWGRPIRIVSKQENPESMISAEFKFIGAADVIPWIIWTR